MTYTTKNYHKRGAGKWVVQGDLEVEDGGRLIIDGNVVLANQAATIPDKGVTAGKIDDDAVATITIADGAVTEPKIADDAVTTVKIDDEAVTAGKIAAGAVTAGKLGSASVTAGKLATDAVVTAKIEDAAVTAAKLAPDVGDLFDAKLTAEKAQAVDDLEGAELSDVGDVAAKVNEILNALRYASIMSTNSE